MANINIGGRLHSTATGNVVAGANEILDDVKGKKQSVINQETDEALAGKQAALVSGTNIKTVNGESILGSGNIQAGDPDAIKYSTQTLTDAQKTQARTNIGAYNKPGTGIPATDLASAAQTSLGKADTAYQKPQSGVPKSDLASGVQSSLDLADTAVQAENVGPILPPPETDEFATKTQVTQLEAEVNGISAGEETIVPTITDGGYKQQKSGTSTEIQDVTNSSNSLITVNVNAGEVYDLQFPTAIGSAMYRVYFIFAINGTTASIPQTSIANYVSEKDSVNHIYRVTIPTGTNYLYSSVSTNNHSSVTIKKITEAVPGLIDRMEDLEEEVAGFDGRISVFEEGNFDVDAVQIDGTEQDISTEAITPTFADGGYPVQASGSENTTINTTTSSSNTTIKIPCREGDVVDFFLPGLVASTIQTLLYTYCIFAVSDTVSAVAGRNNLSNYVESITDVTGGAKIRTKCPAGTTEILSSCAVSNKGSFYATKIIQTKELKWLLVKESNIDKEAVTSIVNKSESQTLATLESNGKKYHLWDSIKKKFDFSGKKLTGFGDSITSGVSSPGLVTITDSYLKLFCDYAGVTTYRKMSISGSCIADADGDGGYSIYERVTGYAETTDAIVIAGGTNDWNTGKPLGTFGSNDVTTVYGALKGICEYLQTNYPDAYVVFITPIPYTKPASAYPNHIAPLDEYRSAIYDVATYYGYSVVSGLDLGMPREQGGWNNTMCDDTDGCHPTARGHALYARSLAGKLL